MLSLYDASQRERAAVAAFAHLERDLQNTLRKAARAKVLPGARDAVVQHATNPTLRKIAARATLSVSRGVPSLTFGGRAAATSKGTPGRFLVQGLEFGSYGRRYQTYDQKRPTGTVRVKRRTTRQFMPARTEGAAILPAIEDVADDVIAWWTDAVEEAVVSVLDEAVS